jgi:hypothetical protein
VDPRVGLRWLAIGAAAAGLVASLAIAQPALPPTPVAPTDETAPPPPSLGPVVAPPPMEDAAPQSESETAEEKPPPKIEEPVGPPRPERSPTAILRVLDKVTAETLRFEAPVGRRIRYKSIVFEVRACETWGVHAPDPRPSAYVVVDSDLGSAGSGVAGSKEIYKGWMFAQAPGVHALQHPVYDAWLESCEGAPAPTT